MLYADGSQHPCDSVLLSSPNIQYFHLPSNVPDRLRLLLRYISTPYAVMIGDDEFYLPSALDYCVNFLDSNLQYVACMGRAIGFSRSNQGIAFKSVYPRLLDLNLNEIDSYDRLKRHFSNYVSAHSYAVTRSDLFNHALEKALRVDLKIYAITELVYEFIVLSRGMSFVAPFLFWLRSFEAPPIRNTGETWLNPSNRFNDWWLSDKLSVMEERKRFCDELALAACRELTSEDVASILDCYVESAYGDSTSFYGKLRHFDKNLLPAFFVERLKIIKSSFDRQNALQELRDQSVRIDEAGLAECVFAIEESWKR